tara:strand:+ start:1630 stop:1731 length:102 start_codon:yes stop_codon:yes gene_type:complete
MISNVDVGEQEESAGFNRLRFFDDENNSIEIKD